MDYHSQQTLQTFNPLFVDNLFPITIIELIHWIWNPVIKEESNVITTKDERKLLDQEKEEEETWFLLSAKESSPEQLKWINVIRWDDKKDG